MTADLSGVTSVMEPEELQVSLAKFDPIVTFIPVQAEFLPGCRGAMHGSSLNGPDATAVLVMKRQLKDSAGQFVFDESGEPVYSKPGRMPTASCCRDWETSRAVHLGCQVTVEVLMIGEVA